MRLILTALVLALDLWAIASILGSDARALAKLGWTLLVIALPVLGFVAWLLLGPRRSRHT